MAQKIYYLSGEIAALVSAKLEEPDSDEE